VKENAKLAQSKTFSVDAVDMSRRGFLTLAGMTTATLALRNSALAQQSQPIPGQESNALNFHEAQLAGTHDLVSLPQWGPYSKKFHGISHIPDVQRGISFDLSIFPSLAQAPAQLPSVTDPSSVHPWDVASDLSFYSFRFETLWKDQLYADLSFCKLNDRTRLIHMELVNQTSTTQEIVLHSLSQLCFPPLKELTAEPIRLCDVELPPEAVWVHALDYSDLTFAKPRPTDNLVTDGKFRGEARHHDCVGGSAVAERFGHDEGDALKYRLHLDHAYANAVLVWRYRLDRGQTARFQIDGIANRETVFEGTGDFTTVSIPLGPLSAGACDLSFVSLGDAEPILNGFVLVEASQAASIRFVAKPWNQTPQTESIGTSGILMKYADTSNCYGLSLDVPWTVKEQLKWRDLDGVFQSHSSDYTRGRIYGNSKDRAGDPDSLFLHAASQSVALPANSRRLVRGVICTGTEAEVRQSLVDFKPNSSANDRVFLSARSKAFQFASTPTGDPYRFSQQRLAAVTLANLVYPLYTQGNYIRHNSPGKIWDCLYTWDSGFIGLGLLELDPNRAIENLNTYTTPEGAQSAFIHHGSPLATQIYLYSELWNRTQSKEMLAYLYPRLRQFYRFLLGRYGSSTTRQHQDRLLVTWDYFYNSGGWDDYPPQKFMHQQNLTSITTPTVSSSHAVRCAKLLRQAAEELGQHQDFAEYDRDIAELSQPLQQYSWDSASGYFGYILHDAQGKPAGILRSADGANFNMGLDGVSPLIAGICNPEQTDRILENIFSYKHLWTEIGITTVDQSAPYYITDGYWNGSVWLAHQWFLWKTMFDLGRGDLAVRIAQTGLDLWKSVTDSTYDCREHFYPKAPHGSGWVQFSSLSSPALSWFAALYTPGRFTSGFDVWIQSCQFLDHNRELRAKLNISSHNANREASILACMHPESQYRVSWNGSTAKHTVVHDGLLLVQLPAQSSSGELSIVRA
jgi:Glycosyl hydrolase family 63 C-terminal domain